jgi:hypothetical protein
MSQAPPDGTPGASSFNGRPQWPNQFPAGQSKLGGALETAGEGVSTLPVGSDTEKIEPFQTWRLPLPKGHNAAADDDQSSAGHNRDGGDVAEK